MSLYRTIPFLPLFCCIAKLSSAQNFGDCATAFPLCDQAYMHFTVTADIGYVEDAPSVSCFMNGANYGQAEENSTWIAFNIYESGNLTFAINPDNINDDMDFVLFKLPEDGNCDQKIIVRCMSAGGGGPVSTSPCMGATGLRMKEKDTQEDAGCSDAGDNNWLKQLDARAGEKYVLLVSNTTAPNGFTIRFKGSAILQPCVKLENTEP